MTPHIEIVSVTYRRAKAGEREPYHVDDWAISRPSPDEWPDEIKFYDWADNPITLENPDKALTLGIYFDIPTDWFGFRFEFFGQFFEHEQSALGLECDAGGAEDTFGDFVEPLRAIGEKLLEARNVWNPPDDQVTFLTAWWYASSRDYEGGWDHEWDLIGLVDLSRIREIVVKEGA